MKKIFVMLLSVLFISAAACSEKKVATKDTLSGPQKITLKTNHGDIVLELYPEVAPKTVANFIGLASGTKEFSDPQTGKRVKRPYYDGVIFHRIIPNFMIQGGDILGNGTGGPGFTFEDEISASALGLDKMPVSSSQYYTREAQQYVFQKLNITSQEELDKRLEEVQAEFENLLKNNVDVATVLASAGYQFQNHLKSMPMKQYTIAMANAGPNTNGSQFFINLVDNEFLNGKHTVFGKVVDGFDVVEKIAQVKTSAGDRPVEDVIIKKVVVTNE